jgi:hypothetical protein
MEDVSGDIKTEINPETQLTTTAVDGWIACAQQVPISPFFIESQSQYDRNNAQVKKTLGKTRPNAMRRRMLTREGE